MPRGSVELIEIEAIADGGVALGRMGRDPGSAAAEGEAGNRGKAVFVPFAAPGDLVRARITREKRSHAFAELLEVVRPGESRLEPVCPLFGRCGGCAWQHVRHAVEVEGKADALRGFFQTRLGIADEVFGPAISSPLEYGYRNRVTLHPTRNRGGSPLGFKEAKSASVVPVARCPVAEEPVNEAIGVVAEELNVATASSAVPHGGAGFKQRLVPERLLVQVDDEGSVFLSPTFERAPPGGVARWWRDMAANAGFGYPGGREMRFTAGGIGADIPFKVRPGAFVQANSRVNRKLGQMVAGYEALYSGADAVDLFCGSGNFTLLLAERARWVTGVEFDRAAVESLATNASGNGIVNVDGVAADARKPLDGRVFEARFLLLDPPRTGAGEVAAELAARSGRGETVPDHILYISCAPPTLQRDLAILTGAGYEPVSLRAVDMFPRTAHLEVVTLLERKI